MPSSDGLGMQRAKASVLVVDNYDSFTHNAVDCLAQLGCRVEVVRNDALSLDDVRKMAPDALVLSPGPGRPRDAGITVALVRALGRQLPILGICLGHQAIAEAYGGRIVRAKRPLHGEAAQVQSRRVGVLRLLPQRFEAARYHSLVVDPRRPGQGVEVTATSEEGEIMGLRHVSHPVEGVQFHPESHLTPLGPLVFEAFLRGAGCGTRSGRTVRR